MHTIGQLEPASSDIAIGVLPLHSGTIEVSEATIPYFHMKISWYVPCPNPTSHWKSIYKFFDSPVWAFYTALEILVVIIMWLLAKYETQLNVRESENYKKLIYCVHNMWAIHTGVSVPQKPISLSLRIIFIV
jgi:hypothetical protein